MFSENEPTEGMFSDLKAGQKATLFPSFGYFDEKHGCWRAFIHGRVTIDDRIPLGTRILLRGLTRAMRATPEDVASEIFQRRIYGFLAAPGRRRKIVLEVDGHQFRLKRRTRRNGAFYGRLKLPEVAVEQATASSSVLQMQLIHSSDELGTIAPTAGQIYLVKPRGVSIVSDIDDTIKLTEATSKSEMLANTFLRPFAVIEGMSQTYQQWKTMGCDFHYVSSSPWQLYETLAELCNASSFPAGSMHLRYFSVRDEMFKRFRPIRRNTKVGIIARLLKLMPQRKFVLIGDSGEKDPEVYRFLAKRFPEQIAAVLIRQLPSRPLDAKQLRKLGSIAPASQLHVFSHPDEIVDVVRAIVNSAND